MPGGKHEFLSYSTDINPALRQRRLGTQKKRKSHLPKRSAQSQQSLIRLRAIMGQKLPLTDDALAGENSFPGPDVTYSPAPKFVSTPIVNLGCLNSSTVTDIVQVGLNWPLVQGISNFGTGSSPPGVTTPAGVDPSQASSTPFQSSVYLTADQSLYNYAAVHNGYSPIALSQEGLLWTLWPLTQPEVAEPEVAEPEVAEPEVSSETYFNQFVVGTSRRSNYPLGQMGFFINNEIMGYTPIGVDGFFTPQPEKDLGPTGIDTENVLPGVQGLNPSIIMTTEQQLGLIVVKVSEQIARIYNPVAGASSEQRFLYVGYDAWAVVYTTANPMGPMAAETYVSPRPTTTVGENYQVVLPPNFSQTVYYKNKRRYLPFPEPSSIDAMDASFALSNGVAGRTRGLAQLNAAFTGPTGVLPANVPERDLGARLPLADQT